MQARAVLMVGLVVLLAGMALAQPVTNRGYVPVKETTCWTCHSPWNPPLRDFGAIIPPETLGSAVGEEFRYTVQFRNLWTPGGSDPVIQKAGVVLDLANAPSLIFGGGLPDVQASATVSITANPQNPQSLTQYVERNATFEVAPGATRMVFSAVPDPSSPTPADIQLVIRAPGRTIIEDNATVGQAEVRELDAATLATLAPGNWSIGARFIPLSSSVPPTFTPALQVELTQDGEFDVSSQRSLGTVREADLGAGRTFLSTWTLKPLAAPAPGEKIVLSFRGTAYYDHLTDVQGGDYGDFITTLEVPLGSDGDQTVLIFTASQAARPQIANGPTLATVSEAIGYASAMLLISSIWSGGMFGMTSRRQLNNLFKSAKRRVSFHNFLSYGLMLGAAIHTVIFLIEAEYQWTLGIIWGTLSILAMAGLGVTGAFQVALIRSWGYNGWKWTHYGMAVAAILFTVVHGLLDGVHFGEVQGAIGWKDPFLQVPGA